MAQYRIDVRIPSDDGTKEERDNSKLTWEFFNFAFEDRALKLLCETCPSNMILRSIKFTSSKDLNGRELLHEVKRCGVVPQSAELLSWDIIS